MDVSAVTGWQPSQRYPDPAVQIVDEGFARYRLANAKVERLRCANVCFGGTYRNRLFMCASTSIYALYVNTQGGAGG